MSSPTHSSIDDAPDDTPHSPEEWTRREAVAALGALGLAGAASPLSSASSLPGDRPPGPDRPNILFIMSDDHALRGLSCYEGRVVETPNLDRLAEEGMKFENCFVTNAICSPSRATMLTGKYGHKNGVKRNVFFGRQRPFNGAQMTAPKRLRKAGYETVHIGKWHLGGQPTGFDYWKRLPAQGRYHNPRFLEKPTAGGQPNRVRESGYVTDVLTKETMKAIEERRDEEPFYLQCWHKAPHRKWKPARRHQDLFSNVSLPPPATFNDDYYSRSRAAKHARMRISKMPDWKGKQPQGLTETERKHWNYQRYVKNYLRTIKALDEGIGRLLDYLDETGLAENTLVVYTTDNGMFVGEHGFYDKRFMYEEAIRIPLLMRYPPMVEPGTTERRMARNLDLAPTFLDLAGMDIPEGIQGRSLRPLLEQREDPDWEAPLYYHYYEYPRPHRVHRHYGIRTDRYKLIYYYRLGEWELFDLQHDPHELQNVVDDARYEKVRRRLKEGLRNQRAQYGDQTGKPVPKS